MKIVEQSHEILHLDGLERIERAGRTCYKSEEKIGCTVPRDKFDPDMCEPPLAGEGGQGCQLCDLHSSHHFVKALIKRGHEAMIEHGSATVRFVTNRGVTHELVRHRVASFGQESTRYVNYGGKEMEFILPVWLNPSPEAIVVGPGKYWAESCHQAELHYNLLLQAGWTAEKAREVLPNSLKTEIVVTANYREWRHILALRAIGTTGKPHPQMQALMLPLLAEFREKLPVVFGDL